MTVFLQWVCFCSVYTDIDVVKEEPTEEQKNTPVDIAQLGPNLDRLWAYSCLLTKGRNVSCMAWNRLNPVGVTHK